MEISPETAWAFAQLIYAEAIDEINRVLTDARVTYMLLKGAYLIESGLSSLIKKRGMCDIDILVSPADFDRAMSAFGQKNYARVEAKERSSDRHFDLAVAGTRAHVELHYRIRPDYCFLLPVADLFDRGRSVRGNLHVPSSEDGLLMTILHLLNHLPFGGMEQAFADIDIQVAALMIDWTKFWSVVESTGVASFVWLILALHSKNGVPSYLNSADIRFWYARQILRHRSLFLNARMPRILCRALFEFPFMRSPATYLLSKILR